MPVTSTDHNKVSFWWKARTLCPSTALPISILVYYSEYVFNDIQLSTHITIIIVLLEPHLQWMMPSMIVIVYVFASLCVWVCVPVTQLLMDLHYNEPCCFLILPWWRAVIIQLQKGRRAAKKCISPVSGVLPPTADQEQVNLTKSD